MVPVPKRDGHVTSSPCTHLGLYRYTRLPFGIASAPAIFHGSNLSDIPHVICYMDNILFTGSSTSRTSTCFLQDSVEYLGHHIDITYAKFIPNLSTLVHPLHALLQTGHWWKWTGACERAFRQAKEKLMTAPMLTHYNPKLPITLAADASAYGKGAVIPHSFADGTERPVACIRLPNLVNE